jgi:mono/diheme cytochrome c family protein
MGWRRLAVVSGVLLLPALAAAQPDVTRGYKLYVDHKCSACHSISGYGNIALPLDEVGASRTDADIREWLIAPDAMRGKTGSTKKPPMPSYGKLSARDIDALVAYLKSLKKE